MLFVRMLIIILQRIQRSIQTKEASLFGISKPLSMRTCLVLPYMLGLEVISFSEHVFVVFLFIGFQQKKKNWGEDAELYFFLLIAFQILHVFLPDNSVHCVFIKYAYI
jgi:hypothetical protein